ncbi:MAG: DUF5067 domain-containing protein [Ruminococcaceae bacterium]|nr:DUF5067 domain-containing protein [Oscillospiraceae bacterium]
MKKIKILSVILLSLLFVLFAMGSGEDTSTEQDQGSGVVATEDADNTSLGDYKVEILDSRMAKDYSGNDVIIIKYSFTNNSDSPTAFYTAFEDNAYQNDIGLNDAILVEDSAEYSADNQTKDIKTGATLEVEVAYELNDTTSDVVVEVTEFLGFDDTVITKTFKIAES